ncbi:CGNR zinc finger domain-containing protein [Deinococcus roseus]|nr:CGNR zinc finger domain-containing protein [Deinococcus roseus]
MVSTPSSTSATSSHLQPSLAAEQVLAFVNTRANKLQPEQFPDAVTLERWLQEHQLMNPEDVLTDTDLQEALQLRAALVVVLLSHLEDPEAVAPEDLQQATAHLHHLARSHPLISLISDTEVSLVPARSGGSAALGRLLGLITELVLTGRWNRLKACRNDGCQNGFYDRTRNGAGTFCSQNPCGALMAMRAYRKRKQQTQQVPES